HVFIGTASIASLILGSVVSDRARSQATVRERESLLRAVVEGTHDAIYAKDRQGRYLALNTACAQILGKRVEDVLGKDHTKLFNPVDAKRILETDRDIMQTGLARRFDEELTVAGASRVFSSIKAPYRDDAGRVIGTVGISRDMTERARAEEERVKLLERLTEA